MGAARTVSGASLGFRVGVLGGSPFRPLAVVAGVAVAFAIVLPVMAGNAPSGRPLSETLFWFSANMTLESSGPGAYVYNITFYSISGGNASTAWTQFFSGHRLLVALVTPIGSEIAEFNSSNSSFQPQDGFNAATFPYLGGWTYGYGAPVVVGDTFVVDSSVLMGSSNLWLCMAQSLPPHAYNEQTLLS